MKKFISLVLCIMLLVSVIAVSVVTFGAAESQYARSTVEGSAVLHCMNWSYNTIKANLQDIRDAGYTAVQTSPIQPPKDYGSSWTDLNGQWWKMYQPIDFYVADGNTWLGTKEELKSLCTEADKYGIKVIVDIVANHMANKSTENHHAMNGIHTSVNATLRSSSSYWHVTGNDSSGSSRYDMVRYDIGMPDLNTSNSYVQSLVLNLLKECVDCGVDGFRFDAAQNIEVPSDDSSIASNFWPAVMNGINSYKSGLFCYGEVYYDAWGGLDDYLYYIGHVTEPISGLDALAGAVSGSASDLADISFKNNKSAEYNVLWVESHDSYFSGTGYSGVTSGISDENIIRAWAIVGSRNKATSLFFARPNSTMRLASSDTTWKSPAVAEVNKFKNYFAGQSEYMAYSGKVAYNERGTSGVVISKLDGAGSVSLNANRIASGTYKDQITGNTFTVSGGKITGTVGDTGVAVVYNVNSSDTTPTQSTSSGGLSKTYYLFGYINGSNYACEEDSSNIGTYRFGSDGTLTATFSQDSYVAVKTSDNKEWFMTDGWQGKVSSATLYNTSITGENSDKLYVPANTKVTFTLVENSGGTLRLSYENYQEPTAAPTTAAPTVATTEPETQKSTEPLESYLVGDANGDGDIDILDATHIQRLLARFIEDTDGSILKRCRLGDEESLDITHATGIQRYLARFECDEHIGQLVTG